MSKKENKKAYILYQYNSFNNDIEYIKEYYNKKELEKEFNLKDRSIYNYICKDIDNIKELLNNKYLIIKEDL